MEGLPGGGGRCFVRGRGTCDAARTATAAAERSGGASDGSSGRRERVDVGPQAAGVGHLKVSPSIQKQRHKLSGLAAQCRPQHRRVAARVPGVDWRHAPEQGANGLDLAREASHAKGREAHAGGGAEDSPMVACSLDHVLLQYLQDLILPVGRGHVPHRPSQQLGRRCSTSAARAGARQPRSDLSRVAPGGCSQQLAHGLRRLPLGARPLPRCRCRCRCRRRRRRQRGGQLLELGRQRGAEELPLLLEGCHSGASEALQGQTPAAEVAGCASPRGLLGAPLRKLLRLQRVLRDELLLLVAHHPGRLPAARLEARRHQRRRRLEKCRGPLARRSGWRGQRLCHEGNVLFLQQPDLGSAFVAKCQMLAHFPGQDILGSEPARGSAGGLDVRLEDKLEHMPEIVMKDA
mmetsp:Transcript_119299/g.380312  ORF Transcript_119299/g.380312 Transcript_119299/m.380312 type:complete len:405 (+) Transcript_119299:1118-2332(+)